MHTACPIRPLCFADVLSYNTYTNNNRDITMVICDGEALKTFCYRGHKKTGIVTLDQTNSSSLSQTMAERRYLLEECKN